MSVDGDISGAGMPLVLRKNERGKRTVAPTPTPLVTPASPARQAARRQTILGLGLAIIVLTIVATVVTATRPPWFERAYVVVLGQADPAEIVGSPEAPYINGLIQGYGLATGHRALTHPAPGNYLALVTGSTHGATDALPADLAAPNLFDQLEEHERTWRVHAQAYPGGCFTGDASEARVDLVGIAGAYERSRNPALSFTAIRHNPARCGSVLPLADFDPGAADFQLIIPSDANGMANGGTLADADAFLEAFVPLITSRADFARAVLFIVWAEGTSGDGGGSVPLIVVTPDLGPGFVSPVAHTHRALVRTLQDAWGLGCLPATCEASNLGEFFEG